MIIKSDRRKLLAKPVAVSRRLVLASLLLNALVVLAGLGALYLLGTRPNLMGDFHRWTDDLGYMYSSGTSKTSALMKLPRYWLTSPVTPTHVESLILDVKFKHMQVLKKKRSEALRRGILVQGVDDYVPASIRMPDKTVRAKLRLKGDLTDHFEGNNWSFRVHVKGDDHIFGMRRFSLQHPKVRDFHFEPMFFEAVSREGVLVPRYFFVDVVVNGEDYGRMALEEHFSKELLESQDRPESVILKFDETEMWAAEDGFERGLLGVFDNYASSLIAPFRSSRVAQSQRLTDRLHDATGLLRGFIDGHLQASEVFDVDLLGRYIAVSEIFGSRHALRWHNQRFYYHPVTARLEPVGFDANAGHPEDASQVVNRRDPIVLRMLSDTRVAAVYREVLSRWSAELADGRKINELQQVEAEELLSLSDAFPLLEKFNFERLITRTNELIQALDAESGLSYPNYPAVLRAARLVTADQEAIQVDNLLTLPVEVVSLHCGKTEEEPAVNVQLKAPAKLPLHLPATPKAGNPQSLRFDVVTPDSRGECELFVTGRIVGQARTYTSRVGESVASISVPPVQTTSIERLLVDHPFLQWDSASKTVTVPAGVWDVAGTLAVPSEASLLVGAGATLRFSRRGALVAYGPVEMKGTKASPIVLRGQTADGWEGLVVIPGGRSSRLTFVTVQDTNGLDRRGWRLSSGATFYQSDVRLRDCRFLDNRTEDALNIVRSTFLLENLEIRGAISDGFDSDFSTGEIRNGHFESIGAIGGGDAVDISGGRLELQDVRFKGIGDKAISAGEGSVVVASRVAIESVGAGAVSKDGSELTIRDSTIKEARLAGLMAYVKKPEFGPGRVTAVNIAFAPGIQARVQTGSSILLDGEPVLTEDIDVDALYDTDMKPGLAR